MNNSSGTGLVGENDLAQNPFDLKAEHGRSLFDARQRFVASGTWQLPFLRTSHGLSHILAYGWQVNLLALASSGTPFTVYDSANVSLQASSPPLSAYFASRPDLIGDPNAGPHTPTQWIDRSAFLRLNPLTQAGQFGNAGRNIATGPGLIDLDASVIKDFVARERLKLQFRAESFNIGNHPNFSVPVADLASQNFGRILTAGPACADAIRTQGVVLLATPAVAEVSFESELSRESFWTYPGRERRRSLPPSPAWQGSVPSLSIALEHSSSRFQRSLAGRDRRLPPRLLVPPLR